MELSKKDKKAAREVIEIGLQSDFENGLLKVENILKAWRNVEKDNRDAYQALYKQVTNTDKYIAHRYDGITGSHYLTTVIGLLMDKVIVEDDLKDLSEEVKTYIMNTVRNLHE